MTTRSEKAASMPPLTSQGMLDQYSRAWRRKLLQVLALLSSSYLATGQTSMATDLLARAVDLAPDMEVFRNQFAFSLMASDERDIAVAGLEETVDLGVGSFPTDYLLTMIYLREGNIDAADNVIKRMVSNNPEEPIGYNLQAAVFIARNDLTATIASFERALEVDPNGKIVWEFFNIAEDGILGIIDEAKRLAPRFDEAFFEGAHESCSDK